MKRKSVTIQAAIIGGVCVMVAAFLTIFLPRIFPHPASDLSDKSLSDTQIRSLILERFNYKKVQFESESVKWFDFSGSGKLSEFYIIYKTENNVIADVFSIKETFIENIFHYIQGLEGISLNHAMIDSNTFLFFTTQTGSGAFLDIYIYTYDGIGKAELSKKLGPLRRGGLYIVGNHICASGSNRKYELIFADDSFVLAPYQERIEYIAGSGCHVLRFDLKNKKCLIFFDDNNVGFKKGAYDGYYSLDTFDMTFNEQILIDDNMIDTPDYRIKTLISSEFFEWIPGFFKSLKPCKLGNSEISVRIEDSWYHIPIRIEEFSIHKFIHKRLSDDL